MKFLNVDNSLNLNCFLSYPYFDCRDFFILVNDNLMIFHHKKTNNFNEFIAT